MGLNNPTTATSCALRFVKRTCLPFCLLVLLFASPAYAQNDIEVQEIPPPLSPNSDVKEPDPVAPGVEKVLPYPETLFPNEPEPQKDTAAPDDLDITPHTQTAEPPMPQLPFGNHTKKVAVLQGLNKVNARVSQIKVMPELTTKFGNLEIRLLNCWKSTPDEKPEAAALLQVFENRPDADRHQIFLGWMFASTPGLSALEHPVYDLKVLDCVE
ncbi:MAG: DUF2155 domain-containing protein [Proteobacteria bacterium]|nr:DUF2155 domain-containing protein [Pseudomonadota bacterium]